jgi:hypothetical protein
MFFSTEKIRGKVTVARYRFPIGKELELISLRDAILLDVQKGLNKRANVKELKNFDRKYLQKRRSVNHNIVTDEGDALIADILSNSPARTKIAAATGYMPVGTGWTGTSPKTNTWVNAITGSAQALVATYPILKGSWGAANDNVLQYRAIYAAGSLGSVTVNEVAITSHATDVAANSLLAYAQVTPAVAMTSSDTLQIDWELTFLGS